MPVGYDGCVVSLANGRLECPDGSRITDLDPDEFIGAFDFTRAIEEAHNTTQKQQKTA